jgi:uncharacterized SAM-binding protein YcdF (DUF218 family)
MFLSKIKLKDLTDTQLEKILFFSNNEKAEKSDATILCGTAPKHAVYRAKIASDYYKKGGTNLIITSGSAVSDKTITESAVMHKALLDFGVPESSIIQEPNAFNTIENITCSLVKLCKYCNILEIKKVAIITEPFHLRRALSLARVFLPSFINVFGYTQNTSVQFSSWKSDERLYKCSKSEIATLQNLILQGIISDIKI